MSLIEFARPPTPEVSIIILGFRRADTLARCLRSLAEHRTRHTFEVIVVLNGAAPAVRSVVEDHGVRGAVVVDLPINAGFAGGCNRGVDASAGRLVVLLNDDVEVGDGWLDALVAAVDARPKAGLVGSLLLFPDGRVQDAGGTFEANGMPHAEGRGLDVDDPLATMARAVPYTTACAAAIRREAWEQVGGMDEGYYPAYFEDADLCLRLDAAGWEVWFDPGAVVVHEESASSDQHEKLAAWLPNRERFLARWGPDADRETVRPPEPRRDLDDPAVQAELLRRLAAIGDAHVAALRTSLEETRTELAGALVALDHEREHGAWLLELLELERARADRAEAALKRMPTHRLLRRLRRGGREPSAETGATNSTPDPGAAP